jgi:hypothetical protein
VAGVDLLELEHGAAGSIAKITSNVIEHDDKHFETTLFDLILVMDPSFIPLLRFSSASSN